jgi:hypothetical protein
MTGEQPVKGIFLGRGLPKDAPASFMDWGFVNLDKDGNRVDVASLPPDADLGSLKLGGISLLVGKQNLMPTWKEAANKLRAAIESENFANPGMQEQIDQWLSKGIEGEALHDKVKEAKGLLTLKDVGLAPIEDVTTSPENKGG